MRGRTLTIVASIAALMCVGFVLAQSQDRVRGLKNDLRSLKQRRESVSRDLNRARRATNDVAAQLQYADHELTSLQLSIANTSARLERAEVENERLKVELDLASAQVTESKRVATSRLRAMYMNEDDGVAAVLLGSTSPGDFAARKFMLERVAEYDRELFGDLRDAQQIIQERQTRQEEVVEEIEALKSIQEQEIARLKQARKEKARLLAQLETQESALESAHSQLMAESMAIAAQIRALQASSGQRSAYTGGLMMPVNGSISSGFGMRHHPILNRSRMHTGLDIAAGSGTAISAAAPGTVIIAQYARGYGNYVVIDHGGGLSTLYAHCSRLYVSVGDQVAGGDRIAAVGSTGLSTGPHLHFEVRINGNPVDPRSRL